LDVEEGVWGVKKGVDVTAAQGWKKEGGKKTRATSQRLEDVSGCGGRRVGYEGRCGYRKPLMAQIGSKTYRARGGRKSNTKEMGGRGPHRRETLKKPKMLRKGDWGFLQSAKKIALISRD